MPKPLPLLDVSAPVCCAPLAAGAMSADTALEVALRLKALADPVRVQLMSLVLGADEGRCTCDLAPAVGVSEPTVSHHLKVLREAGLVDCERRGLWAYYYVTPDATKKLSAWLS